MSAHVSGGPKVNKFEQVSSLGHMMSVARGVGLERRGADGWGFLYSEVQCIMGNGHMGPLLLFIE